MVQQRHFLPVGLLLVLVLSLASTEPLDIEEYCTKVIGEYTVFDDEDVVLEMTDRSETNYRKYNCTFLPVTDRDGISRQLAVEILSLTASDYKDDSCTHGAIQMFDSDNNRVLSPYCKNGISHKRYYLGPSGKVNVYNLNYSEGVDKMKFQLLITPVDKKIRKSDNCPEGFFDCANDFNECVDEALKCNGHPNCYKGKDEQDCSNRSSWFDFGSFCIGFGVGGLVVLIGLCCYRCRNRCRKISEWYLKKTNEGERLVKKPKEDEETVPKET